jgi:aspartate kinase
LALLVCKFGGSSVASIDKIKNVALRLKDMQSQGNELVVVVSAMGDTTDELLELAGAISDRNSAREMDMLLATGEQQSAALLALTLNNMKCPAISLSGWQAGIKTDGIHSKARITGIKPERIHNDLALEVSW